MAQFTKRENNTDTDEYDAEEMRTFIRAQNAPGSVSWLIKTTTITKFAVYNTPTRQRQYFDRSKEVDKFCDKILILLFQTLFCNLAWRVIYVFYRKL